ncbi:cytochrome-c oxidase, cbb3-type subunit III [Methylophaga sp. OBS1]|jgi:cytochrome c oxidase cbb3-type subunit 3|uniref:cytochrome-c oxidase, cbb3-type subunit III n=1 Tax=Methylophaga sp. OBS1 TaxID=2991933 RepID=UPI00225A01AB|nr:cytochrome-c oxidase, cbb3-type subunit III [Methylophaga sp. OBS1]MCX4194080.1 cytochrome-c oxidase, cbb3-type subunit III [Methylophaga sp. OBS1]
MADNKKNPNEVSDTGHEWDGIRELENPPPRWWTNALYLSGLLVLVYFILYPSLPLINESTKGLLGWTMIKEYKENLAEVEAKRAPFEEKLAAMTAEEILADQDMRNYAVGSSKVLYGDNCAACHGTGGIPAPGSGYPILADDDWLYGGDVNTIVETLAKGRQGMMMAHKDTLKPEEVDGLVQFVVNAAEGKATEAGWKLFNDKGCVGCHGADGKGIHALGSANLTDQIWRFSGEPEEIRYTILHGVNDPSDPKTRVAVMPGWNEKLAVKLEALKWDEEPEYDGTETERLTETEIKKLAVYVHQFGGGQ